MSTRAALPAIASLVLLSACPHPEPPPLEGGELREGRWSIMLRDVRVTDGRGDGPVDGGAMMEDGRDEGGRAGDACGGLDPRELEGQEVSAIIEVDGRRAWMDLDGLELQGRFDGWWLDLSGSADVGVVVTEETEVGDVADPETDTADDADEEAPPPCDAPDTGVDEGPGGRGDRGGEGLRVHLGADVLDPVSFDGLLELAIELDGGRCVVEARALGQHVDDGVAMPGDDDEPLRDGDQPDDDEDGDIDYDIDVDTGMP